MSMLLVRAGLVKIFFTHLANYFHTLVFDHCFCIGGDFNCTFEPNLDRNTPEPHPESHKHISCCFSSLGLLDAWRMQHRTASQYTWCRCANGLITLARLDRWYINSTFRNVLMSCNIFPSIFSDHHLVVLGLSSSQLPKKVRIGPSIPAC